MASFTLVMLAVAGGMALFLGIVGLYGVISYSVLQRRREICIRMALGAGKAEVLKMVISQGIKLASYIPARQAAKVDPLVALRQE